MKVDISVAGGPWENLLTRYNTTAGMETEQIDLSAYAGQQAQIRFSFDTKDGVANAFEGWVIDDVSVAAPEPPETDAPAPIQDLTARLVDGVVVLDWTASGDDDLTGTAATYDLRYMTAPIDATNFDLATRVEGVPAPAPAGTPESFTMPVGLLDPNTEYWFAIRAIDDWGNAGDIVNAAQITTGPETIVTVLYEGFDTGAAGWTMEGSPGLWRISEHRYLSPSSALYYGIEETLNFDTGTTNSGTATSPAIDLTDKSHARLSFSDYRQAETGSYDLSFVQVAPAGGTEWTTVWQADYVSEPDTMTAHTVDLSAYDGTVVQVRFSFDTVDSVGNTTEGWVIDDFRVEALSANLMPVPVLSGPTGRVMPGELVHFDASASYDPEGAPLSYSWTVDGVTLSTGDSWLDYTFESGYHLVNLTVSDGIDTQSASHIVQVNTPPVVDLPGPATTVVGYDTLFDASGSSDADGDTLTYAWSVSGVPVGTGPMLLYNFSSIGQYLVSVEVSDGYVTSGADLLVQVNENSAPAALISGPVSGTRIAALTFDGSGSSDPDGHPLTYAWTVDGLAAGTGATLTHTFDSLGLHQVGLTVSDGIDASTTTHEVSIDNLAPTAAITGPASGTRVDALVFDAGTSTDPEGDPLTYAWTIDGAAAGTGPTLTHTFSEIGVYQIGLTVSDGLASHSAAHEVTIANAAPTADIAGPASGTRLDALVFDAGGSTDPEGEPLTYAWTVDGAAAGTGPTLTRTFSELGVYQIGLTVSDGTDSATATHTVTIDNLAPTAAITGPASGTRLDALQFQAEASDAEGDALTYAWTIDGTAAGSGTTLAHTFGSIGTHQLGLTVSDGIDTATTIHEVTIANLPPEAAITGPATGTRLDALVFQASGSDPEGDPLTYAWSIDGAAAGTGESLTHTFDSAGEHQVALTVSDGFDATTVTHSVVIENLAPTASISGPDAGNRIDALSFDGSASSDPEGDPLTYAWMIDGAPAGTGPLLDFTFNSLGVRQVVLTVSDGIDSHTASHSVVIENIAPTVDAGPDQSVYSRDPVTLTGSAWDRDGTIISTTWTQASGTPVDLVVNGLTATFEAPKLTAEKQTTLTFELSATDELGATVTDLVTVYVSK